VCSAAIFGDFTQIIYALWGGLDTLVDPYTGGTAGNVRIITASGRRLPGPAAEGVQRHQGHHNTVSLDIGRDCGTKNGPARWWYTTPTLTTTTNLGRLAHHG
jgi:hypothetical protein